MTMMMSLSLAMIQMLTIASEDQPNQCHTHRIFFCGNKHQMRSDLFPPLHKQTKRFWWWYFSKLKKKDVRKIEARRYCVWHFAQSHPIFIQNWASTKSQVVYLAISPLPLSLSIDLPCIYEIERESIMAKPFANHPNKKENLMLYLVIFWCHHWKNAFWKGVEFKKKRKARIRNKILCHFMKNQKENRK